MFGKMRKSVHVLTALFVLAAVLITPTQVQAATSFVPDESIPGSVEFTLVDKTTNLPDVGAGILAMKVGDVHVENGADYSFAPVAELAGSGISFEDITSPTLAEELDKYILEHGVVLTSKEATTDANGTVKFTDLSIGLWLFKNIKAGENFKLFSPFVVSVPFYNEEIAEKEKYEYDIIATPKVSVDYEPSTSITPSITVTPKITTTPTPSKPHDPLPQTGQLWWPVPVLALIGAALVLIGWFRRRAN